MNKGFFQGIDFHTLSPSSGEVSLERKRAKSLKGSSGAVKQKLNLYSL
jgi:hypothetical protein